MTLILILMAFSSGALAASAARSRAPREGQRPAAPPDDPPADPPHPSGVIDIARACREAARTAGAAAARSGTSVRFAAAEPLLIAGDAAALTRALARMAETAVAFAPGGAVLMTASLHGGQARIAALSDAPGPPRDVLEAALRDAAEAAAMQGCTLDVESGPRGAAIVLRVLARQPQTPAPVEPAPAAAPAAAPVGTPVGTPGAARPAPAPAPV